MGKITYLVIIILTLAACRKDERITADSNVTLDFSEQNISFDTVFTSVSSTFKNVKIRNRNDKAVNISEIRLANGDTSAFNININGERTNKKNNIVINAGDSISILIKVSIDPNSKIQPFLVKDSILLNTNGSRQSIKLLAYGQNAVFIHNPSIEVNTTWTEGLPYIISGTATVKNGISLTLMPGTRLYFHKDARLNVEGSLIVNGLLDRPIIFSGDRLERIYSSEPGQWNGILIQKTGSAIIKHARIMNAIVGITSDSLSTNTSPKLLISNSIIKNMQVAAYIGHHSELIAFNNLLYNCGNYLIYGIGGGNFNLKQNTFVGFNSNFARKTAAVTLSDYISGRSYNNLNLNLTNNIIWGSLENELDIQNKSIAVVSSTIYNNLIKSSQRNYASSGNLLNDDPKFISEGTENFQLQDNSPLLKRGYDLRSDAFYGNYLSLDLANMPRLFPSTLGCFEKK